MSAFLRPICIVLFLQILGISILSAQAQIPIRLFTSEDEIHPLPGSAVTDLYQDSQGYLWMCIFGVGLIRYDGKNMTSVLRVSELFGEPRQVAEDGDGYLWLAGNKGIAVSEQPLHFYTNGLLPTFRDSIGDVPLPKGAVDLDGRMIKDRQGRLLIMLVGEGFIRVRTPRLSQAREWIDSLKIPPNTKPVKTSQDFLRQDGAVQTYDNHGFFLSYGDSDLNAVDTIFADLDLPEMMLNTGGGANRIMEDKEGNLWMVRGDGAFSVWKAGHPGLEGWISVAGMGYPRDMILTRDGRMIFGGEGGMLVTDVQRFPDYTRLTAREGLPSPYVYSLLEDMEGNIWAGTLDGLGRILGDFEAFERYTDQPLGDNGVPVLTDAGVNGLFADVSWGQEKESLLLVGTSTGLNVINQAGQRVGTLTTSEGLLSDVVVSVGADHAGRIWVGTQQGLNCIAPLAAPLHPAFGQGVKTSWMGEAAWLYRMNVGAIMGILPLKVPQSETDSSAHDILAIPTGRGLILLMDDFAISVGGAGGFVEGGINDVEVDTNGFLYLASSNTGLYRSKERLTYQYLLELKAAIPPLNLPGLDFFHVIRKHPIFEKDSLQWEGELIDSIASVLYQEPNLWLLGKRGLMAYNPQTRSITRNISSLSGIGMLKGIDYDAESGWIWMGSGIGLLGLNPDSPAYVRHISAQDGLVGNGIWGPHSFQIGQDGTYFYGTNNGVSLYRPDKDRPLIDLPQVIFSSIQESSYEDGFQQIRFDYNGLGYYWENAMRYRSRLIGYESDWSIPTEETQIRYTNLPAFLFPKSYRFEVEAGDRKGNWSGKPAHYSFKVDPPWYLQWWAILAALLIIGGLIWAYFRQTIRAQKKALAQQKEINEKLEQIDRLKDQFLANTSHELRTPLNGIIGITEAMFEKSKDDFDRENLGMVIASGKRLNALVNDLLDFSKLKHADLILNQRPLDLRSIADVVLQVSFPLIRSQSVVLENEIPVELAPVYADENRLSQVLFNLIGNAIKFTEEGFVRIAAKEKDGLIVVSIADSGIGIPEDKLEVIFKEFEQADGSISRTFAGTGLGLSISKQLIENHGGQLWVESEVSVGSTFFFTLPISSEQAESDVGTQKVSGSLTPLVSTSLSSVELPVFPIPEQGKEAISILIVDDEPINHQVLKNHLLDSHYRVVSAMGGAEAINILKEDPNFDLIVLDVMMPGMSGYELCQKIREQYLPSEIPIIMATAKNQISDLVQGLNIGANDYLAKPFSREEFLARMNTHLNLHRINKAIYRFVPQQFLKALGHEMITDAKLGDNIAREVTVFFSDIRSYTALAEEMSPSDNFHFVNAYSNRMGPIIHQHEGFINQYLGDGIMALFQHGASNALQAAIGMQAELRNYNKRRSGEGRLPLRVGMGFHTGRLIMGIIGDEQRSDPAIIADTVNTASRLEGLTKYFGSNILFSESSFSNLTESEQAHCRYLGLVQLKGKLEPLGIYESLDGEDDVSRDKKLVSMDHFKQGLEAYLAGEFALAKEVFQTILDADEEDMAARRFLNKIQQLEKKGIPAAWTGIEVMDGK